MHESGAQIHPSARPQDIEWAFTDGQPAIVAHIPDGQGTYSVVRLDQIAPESHYEREHVRALMRIAERVMADSEPVNTNGVAR